MLLSSNVNDGILNTLDRLCGTTVSTYSYRAKVADLNDALDWYFQLAFKAGSQWNFDDINNSSPPIDTQNLVSGTNRYKVGSFTEKIIDLLRLEILDSSGVGKLLTPETLQDLDGSFQDDYVDADAGAPTHYIKYGDFIYLRPKPNYSSTSGLKAYFNRPASKFEFVVCTIASGTPAVMTSAAHGLALNDTIVFQTEDSLGTGLSVDTQYYVISAGLTANTFEVSTSQGGSAVATSTSSSGTCSFLKTSKSPGIPSIHHQFLVSKAALTYLS